MEGDGLLWSEGESESADGCECGEMQMGYDGSLQDEDAAYLYLDMPQRLHEAAICQITLSAQSKRITLP